jgi:3-dehydroquinate dehydratase-2
MVDWIQEAFEKDAAVIINPAGFSFDCVPVLDESADPSSRFTSRTSTSAASYQHSLVSMVAGGVICGLGGRGYLLALRAVAEELAEAGG